MDRLGTEILSNFNDTAVGCSNIVPPEDAWLRRSNLEAVVRCYSSRQSWTMRCVDNVWVGVIGNCTRGKAIFCVKENNCDEPDFSKIPSFLSRDV